MPGRIESSATPRASRSRGADLKARFLAEVGGGEGLVAILAYVPDLVLFVKDAAGRFVYVNRAVLGLVGCAGEEDALGRADPDFFPPHLCEHYACDDRAVLTTGLPIVDRVELVKQSDGSIAWYNTTKVPVRAPSGRIVAVAGITRDLKRMRSASGRFLEMAPVLETIMSRYTEPLAERDLAAMMKLSLSQFERQFKRKFGTTPRRYITQVRLKAAAELLAGTDRPIADIAAEAGFYDQSHLTNHFTRHFGLSPLRYRERHGEP
jgi:PAS domain S-box-containing protein